jgi:HTH-type transcriptional regulator, osmoprotectant uptake regulator
MKTNEFEKEVIENGQKIMQGYGLDTVTSKIFMIVFIEPKEISLEDISKKSGYCLSSISTKASLLEKLGIITRVKKPGTKRVFFYMEKDMKTTLISKLEKAIMVEINPVLSSVPLLLEKYKDLKKSKDDKLKKQYNIMEDYLEQTKKVEKIIYKMINEIKKM